MFRQFRNWVLVLVLGFLPSVAPAHPVAYKGAWSFMAFNQGDMLDWQLLYTFQPKFSLGVDFIRDSMMDRERYYLIPRLSWLVHRWNGKDYQANIYVYGGAGIVRLGGITKGAVEGAVEADYETRRVYVSGKTFAAGARNMESLVMYQGRVGFAPYEGKFEDLHSWLIGQVQYFPFSETDSVRVGPVLRLFYRNVLWELGISHRGAWNFNFMVHF